MADSRLGRAGARPGVLALNWSLSGLRTHWAFFPLWLGYCLTVDAVTCWRKGTSLLTRSRRAYALLFVFSIPGWWLFELLNLRTQNWFYEAPNRSRRLNTSPSVR